MSSLATGFNTYAYSYFCLSFAALTFWALACGWNFSGTGAPDAYIIVTAAPQASLGPGRFCPDVLCHFPLVINCCKYIPTNIVNDEVNWPSPSQKTTWKQILSRINNVAGRMLGVLYVSEVTAPLAWRTILTQFVLSSLSGFLRFERTES